MKIKVNRTIEENGDLTFVIKVSEPHEIDFTKDDLKNMQLIRKYNGLLAQVDDPHPSLVRTMGLLTDLMAERFYDIKRKLEFAIHNELNIKIEPIRQEIYNWIYDFQPKHLKTWMYDYDPQRCHYYFDNDRTAYSDTVDNDHDKYSGEGDCEFREGD